MRLADAIADHRPPAPKPGKVDKLLAKVHPDDIDEFMSWMLDGDYAHNYLADTLSKIAEEYVSAETVGKWRRARNVGRETD